MDLIESEKTPVLKFEPPAPVYAVDDEGQIIDEPLVRWDQLTPGVRAAISNPWHEGEFSIGIIHGKPGMILLAVGVSFGALEFIEETGWVCTGLIPQQNIMSELGQKKAAAAREAGRSFTDKLLKRTSKGKKSGTPTK